MKIILATIAAAGALIYLLLYRNDTVSADSSPDSGAADVGVDQSSIDLANTGVPDDAPSSSEGELMSLIWGGKVSPEFSSKVQEICANLQMDANWLMAIMAFESGETFRPDIQNRGGAQAFGLIQFTAASGYDIQALRQKSAVDQLDDVYSYMQDKIDRFGQFSSLSDAYMAVLWPKAIGRDDSYVLFSAPTIQYRQNAGLDAGKKGFVTKADAAAPVEREYRKGQRYSA